MSHGRHDQEEAGERERDGRPLQAAQPLAEEQPRQQEQPERHRVHEHRDLAGAADGERRRGQSVEERGLQEPDEQRPAEGRRPQGPAPDGEDDEEADRPQPRDEPRERERPRVVERDLADHPAVAPEGGDGGEREDAEVAGACGVGAGHGSHASRRRACRAARASHADGASHDAERLFASRNGPCDSRAAGPPRERGSTAWTSSRTTTSSTTTLRSDRTRSHLLKRVAEPTNKVPGPVERKDQRSSVFARSLLGEFGEELEREFKRMTVRYPVGGALVDLQNHINLYPRRANPVAKKKAPIPTDPRVLSRHLKCLGHFLGADIVGIGPLPQSAVYSHDMKGREIDAPYPWAIALVVRKHEPTLCASNGWEEIVDGASFQAYQRVALQTEVDGELHPPPGLERRGHQHEQLRHADAADRAGLRHRRGLAHGHRAQPLPGRQLQDRRRAHGHGARGRRLRRLRPPGLLRELHRSAPSSARRTPSRAASRRSTTATPPGSSTTASAATSTS